MCCLKLFNKSNFGLIHYLESLKSVGSNKNGWISCKTIANLAGLHANIHIKSIKRGGIKWKLLHTKKPAFYKGMFILWWGGSISFSKVRKYRVTHNGWDFNDDLKRLKLWYLSKINFNKFLKGRLWRLFLCG